MTNGTKMDGTTFVMDNLYARRITGSPRSELEVLGDKSVTVSSVGTGQAGARLIVKNNLEMMADSLTVTDTLGEEILAVDRNNVRFDTGGTNNDDKMEQTSGSGGIS